MIISVECILNLTMAWGDLRFLNREIQNEGSKFELVFEDFGVWAQISPWIKNTQ